MRTYLGLAMMTVCAAALGGGFPAPAYPDDLDAARLLSDSKRLLQEQQEIEKRLANSQARTEELRLERERMNREAERINDERQTTRDLCGTSAYYYTHRAECEQGNSQLSTRRAEVDEQQRAIGRRFEATTSEIESLKTRREQLKRQSETLDSTLKRLEFSGVTQECVGQQPSSGLQDRVSAYERCWDGTTADKPRLRPETSNVPSLSPGPIEQMGIEDEKRRRRKARQKELSGE